MALWTLPNRAEIFTQPSMTARNVMGGVITYLLSLAVCCGLLHMTPFWDQIGKFGPKKSWSQWEIYIRLPSQIRLCLSNKNACFVIKEEYSIKFAKVLLPEKGLGLDCT